MGLPGWPAHPAFPRRRPATAGTGDDSPFAFHTRRASTRGSVAIQEARTLVTWSHRAKELGKGALVLVALVAVFLIWVGVLKVLRQASCDRLDAERISHLEPGHATRGPGSIYVIGVGPGPPPSEITEYWEAEAAMVRAGCDVPGE